MIYYHIGIFFKTNHQPIVGVREFTNDNWDQVTAHVRQTVFKRYRQEDILNIDVWPLAEWNPELQDYLAKKQNNNK